jgi:hypothetical protein
MSPASVQLFETRSNGGTTTTHSPVWVTRASGGFRRGLFEIVRVFVESADRESSAGHPTQTVHRLLNIGSRDSGNEPGPTLRVSNTLVRLRDRTLSRARYESRSLVRGGERYALRPPRTSAESHDSRTLERNRPADAGGGRVVAFLPSGITSTRIRRPAAYNRRGAAPTFALTFLISPR